MKTQDEVIDQERRFWQSLANGDADTAVSMLAEPSFLVSGHGVMRIDRGLYRQMAEQGPLVVKDYKLGDMEVEYPGEDVAVVTYTVTQTVGRRDGGGTEVQQMADSSTWVRRDGNWVCVLHTETPLMQ